MIPLLASALGAPCTLDVPRDVPFAVAPPPDASGVMVLPVLRLGEGSAPWARAMLDAFEARDLRVAVSHRAVEPTGEMGAVLEEALDRGHEGVVRLEATELPNDPLHGPRQLRRHLKPLTRVTGRLGAAEAPLGDRTAEAVLHRVGLRAILETNGPASATPRRQQHLESQPDVGIVLPAGPYAGPCGDAPTTERFTPPAADRVTQAAWGARAAGVGVVRVTLLPGDPADAAVLGRWLDEVARPAGLQVGTPSDARARTLRALRLAPEGPRPPSVVGGRLVRTDEVVRAAEALRGVRTLPRTLPGDLTLTEAFQAFLLVLADRAEQDVVRLGALEGPAVRAAPIDHARDVPLERLRELARAVLDERPARVPGAVPVDGVVLAAPELLMGLASAVRGDDPPRAVPVDVPDPNATGLGWGSATTP